MVRFLVELMEICMKLDENLSKIEEIVASMEKGKSYTVSEIQKLVGIETNQKASALIRQLRDNGVVVRKEEKGKAYFSLA